MLKIPKIKRQGILSMAVVYLGIGLGYVNLVLLMPKYFTLEEIGLRGLLIDFVTVFFHLCSVGFYGTVLRFYPEYKEKNEEGYLAFIFIIPLVSFVFFSSILFLGRDILFDVYSNSPLFVQYYYLIFPFTLIFIANSLLDAYTKNYMKVFVPNVFSEFVPRFLFVLLILAVALGYMQKTFFWELFVAIYAIQTALLLGYILYLKRFYIKIKWSALTLPFMKRVMAYSGFTMLDFTATMLLLKFDVLMIGSQLTLVHVGVYTTMVYIATVTEIPKRVLHQFASPKVSKAWHEKDMEALDQYNKHFLKAQVVLSFFVVLGIYYCMNDLFKILPQKEFATGAWVLVFIMLSKVIRAISGLTNEIIVFSDRYKYNFIFNVVAVIIAVVLNYYFIDIWGITGAAFATLLTILLSLGAKVWYVKKVFHLWPFTWNTVYVVLFSSLFFAIEALLPSLQNVYIDIAVRAVFVTVFYLGGLWVLKLVKKEDFIFS